MKTNFFMTENQFYNLYVENKVQFFKAENGCFLLVEDSNFKRIYFIVSNVTELGSFLDYLMNTYEIEITAEIVGKSDYIKDIKKLFVTYGFYEYSSMVRMSRIRKIIDQPNFENIHLLTDSKKEEFQSLYQKYFDKFVERIPSSVEIDEFIESNNAYYFSDNNEIQGFIVFEHLGLTSHLRYWFVHPKYRDKKIGSKLMQLFFNSNESVKRELFWVIESNENAIKRYKHFGFVEEDMHNVILINKNKKYEEPNS
ncbi:GNAT family N-acetyltransferase [Sphingobacterium sp. PU5-4]|uniref:GNAT family N-acetyltransferase n=1 Tax=Sphingobacterium tenebrionis TaxID=3111775 RepID=A0ABU8I1T6_9SPHI